MFLCLPRLTSIEVEVRHVLDGLVAVGILAHLGQLHLFHLVNHSAIGTDVDVVGLRPDRIELADKGLVTSVEVDKSLHIVEDAPIVVPGIAFAVGASPLDGIKGLRPTAFDVAASHETGFGIEDVAIVEHHASEHLLIERIASSTGKLPSAEVVVGILLRLRRAAHRLGIGDIAQLPILLPSGTSVGTTPRAFVHGLVGIGLQSLRRVESTDAFSPSISQQRDSVVAKHAAALAGTRPCRQPSTLLLRLQYSLHILSLLRRMEEIRQGKLRAERVP